MPPSASTEDLVSIASFALAAEACSRSFCADAIWSPARGSCLSGASASARSCSSREISSSESDAVPRRSICIIASSPSPTMATSQTPTKRSTAATRERLQLAGPIGIIAYPPKSERLGVGDYLAISGGHGSRNDHAPGVDNELTHLDGLEGGQAREHPVV